MAFKKGDIVRCNTDRFDYITEGVSYVVQEDEDGDLVIVNLDNGGSGSYSARHFELVDKKPRLKLPLAATRMMGTGRKIVLVQGTKPGHVTVIYADGTDVVTDGFTEVQVLEKFDEGLWTVNGVTSDAETNTALVEEAERELQAAQEAVQGAERRLEAAKAAQAAAAANKPYLV